MPPPPPPQRWDIFCTVIDNYGDIGVCWRLARQLAAEHGVNVRLWVDELSAFSRLCPDLDPTQAHQRCADVEIRRWQTPFPAEETADVVIAAFGCTLPDVYLAAMARRACPPCWINLEYLSAESWVAECHGLPSPHPRLHLTTHFLIPGFDSHSAGLLREKTLLESHSRFQPAHWWPTAGGTPAAGQLSVSLFAYENGAAGPLIDAWADGPQSVLCLVPESRVMTSVNVATGRNLRPGETMHRGNLELRARPFVRQEAYDDLLLACDLNFVRGEDSLVRAIWAGKPFVWHIYRQEEKAHIVKLDAFLDRYCVGLAAGAGEVLRRFSHQWNNETIDASTWRHLAAALPELAAHALRWRDALAQQTDLASYLVDFCRNAGKNRL